MKNLKKYAKLYIKKIAIEEVLKDIHQLALRELKKFPDGKADYEGVEFHLTKKVERKYVPAIEEKLKEYRQLIDSVKKEAEESGLVQITERETFDAYIPRSSKEEILKSVNEYKKHFGG